MSNGSFLIRVGSFVSLSLIVFIRQCVRGQQLDCSFDSKTFCAWSNGINGVEDDFDWQLDNAVAVDGFHSIPRTITGSGYFTFAQGRFRPFESDAAKAWLRSPTIDGTSRPAVLTFAFWKTAIPPILQVCTRNTGDNDLICLDTISGLGNQQWVERTVTIPGNPVPFQIVFVATGFRSALDLVGVDDIAFRFGNASSYSRQAISGRPPSLYQDEGEKNFRFPETRYYYYYNADKQQPTPLIQFDTLRPVYERVDASSYANHQSVLSVPDVDNRRADRFGTASPVYYYPPPPLAPQRRGRPEVFFAGSESKKLAAEDDDEDVGEYVKARSTTASNVKPHSYFTTHSYAKGVSDTTGHSYETTTQRGGHAYEITDSVTEHSYETTDSPSRTDHTYEITESDKRTTTVHTYEKTEGSGGGGGHRYRTTPSTGGVEGECPAVACDFDADSCYWYNDLKANFDWKVKSTEGFVRGIGGGANSERPAYAFVSGDGRKKEQRAALRSPVFRLESAGSFLNFVALLTDSNNGRLTVETSDLYYGDKMLFQTVGYKGVGGSGWKPVRIRLPDAAYPFSIVIRADQLGSGQYIGVDDLSVTDDSGRQISCSFNASMYRTTPASTKSAERNSQNVDIEREFFLHGRNSRPLSNARPSLKQESREASSKVGVADDTTFNGQLYVDVLGEHGGSILKQEKIDAAVSGASGVGQISELDYHPFFSAGDALDNIRSVRFENLIDNPSVPRDTNVLSATNTSVNRNTVFESESSPATDPLGIVDFARRVGDDLTTLLGVNRRSYIFGSDVFDKYPKADVRANPNNWLHAIFGTGRKKK